MKWALVGVGVAVGLLIAVELPNIRRYIRIERM
jgi:hypothetical protein